MTLRVPDHEGSDLLLQGPHGVGLKPLAVGAFLDPAFGDPHAGVVGGVEPSQDPALALAMRQADHDRNPVCRMRSRLFQAVPAVRLSIVVPDQQHAFQTVDEAAWWFIAMEVSCQAQLLAEAAGTPQLWEPDEARMMVSATGTPEFGWASFQPFWDEISESDPDLFA